MGHSSGEMRGCPIGCPEAGDALGELGVTGNPVLSRSHFTLVRCGCGKLLYLSPAPSAADLRTLYVDQEQFGDDYTDEARQRAILAYIGEALDRIASYRRWTSPRALRMLEVGAGLAWMCRAAKLRFPDAVTVAQDVSPEAVGKCTWVDHYEQADIADARFDGFGPYDLISMTHVIEHLVDPVSVVSRCRALLAPGGVMFITAPHRPAGWQDAAPEFDRWRGYSYNHVPAHIQYFSRQSMERLAKRCECSLVYWSHEHEGGEAFETWLAPRGSPAVRSRPAAMSALRRVYLRMFSKTNPPPVAESIDDGCVAFICNLCNTPNRVPPGRLAREEPSCANCASTVRFRSIAQLLVHQLLGEDRTLLDFPASPNIRGIGLSDATTYAALLARKFSYTNTYFDAEPRLDITAVPDALVGRHHFVIASDVFEHVAPPVSRAFEGARRLLRPDGVFILTVPFTLDAETVEHFPELHEFSIVATDGKRQLHNATSDGRNQKFDNLVFHGGTGATLEMRLFSRSGLEGDLRKAGFSRVHFAEEACERFGIVWPLPWGVPVVARP